MDLETDFVWTGLLLSLTVTVNLKTPLVVGIPEITPHPEDKLSPAGRLPHVIEQV
jgi:hypothetical protein